MKVLLDTNIVITRETINPTNEDIGELFGWLDRLKYTKCIHNVTVTEINKNKNDDARRALSIKLKNYFLLPTEAPLGDAIHAVSKQYDINGNDLNDTKLLNEVLSSRVDFLITEDQKVHLKAKALGIESKVFTIEGFIEKVSSENPELKDYKVLSVKKEYFANIDLGDPFFDNLKQDYKGFEDWFKRKANEPAYVCKSDGKIVSFLYLKVEGPGEPYPEISPPFPRKKRLKVGTFKVQLIGYKLGERFIKIIFDNAIQYKVEEVYVTAFNKQIRLIDLLKEYGFVKHGTKTTASGEEEVYVRNMSPPASKNHPKTTYPYISKGSQKFIVSIYDDYHTELFPDSILRTESPLDFIENEPHRNSIAKVYISRSWNRNLKSGDIVVFYRTGGFFRGVITTIGIVESTYTPKNLEDFISACRKRSVFSNQQLIEQWNYNPKSRPFIVNFLYTYSFPKRINMEKLIKLGVIRDIKSAPRGFEALSDELFNKIVKETGTDENIIVD